MAAETVRVAAVGSLKQEHLDQLDFVLHFPVRVVCPCSGPTVVLRVFAMARAVEPSHLPVAEFLVWLVLLVYRQASLQMSLRFRAPNPP